MFRKTKKITKNSLPSVKIKIPNFFLYSRFSAKKQTFFAKRLSFLIKAGMPILDSLHIIKKQSKIASEIRVFEKIIDDVANGQSLANSLSKFRGVFGGFAVNIIKAGESSGNLTVNLNYLADELRKKDMLRSKIISAMLYPAIITIATFLITGLLVVYIFPKILPIFKSLNTELPLTTKIVIFLSDLLREHGLLILGVVLGMSLVLFLLIKFVYRVRLISHKILLSIPLFGKIIKNYNLANITRTLGLLLQSGIPLGNALLVVADTTDNLVYKNSLTDISNSVLTGKNVSDSTEKYPTVFPDTVTHMIGVGEKSGNLSSTLLYLSEFMENEFDDLTKNLSSAIEPILMIIMGFLVGFIAISVITPIYEITNNLKR